MQHAAARMIESEQQPSLHADTLTEPSVTLRLPDHRIPPVSICHRFVQLTILSILRQLTMTGCCLPVIKHLRTQHFHLCIKVGRQTCIARVSMLEREGCMTARLEHFAYLFIPGGRLQCALA